jgi:hypothetical protein
MVVMMPDEEVELLNVLEATAEAAVAVTGLRSVIGGGDDRWISCRGKTYEEEGGRLLLSTLSVTVGNREFWESVAEMAWTSGRPPFHVTEGEDVDEVFTLAVVV